MNKYVTSLLIWAIGASIGFGSSQLMFVGPIKEQMREHNIRIVTLERSSEQNDVIHEKMREDFTRRLTTLVGEQANYVTIAKEYIASSKADRELMQQQLKQINELIQLIKK